MRQILLFIFLVLLIFNGRSQISSLDSLRLVMPMGHSAFISSISYSPDGKYIVTAGLDRVTRIYEVISGKKIQEFKGHTSWVNSATFSPDGNYILTASRDKTARIFSIASGKEVKSFRLSSWLNSAYFNSNGNKILVSGNDDTVRIIEIASGDEIANFIGTDAKYSPDGNMVITSYYNSTKINYLFQEKKPFELYGTSSVCSNNSNMCLTLSKDSLRIYDLENQTLIKVIKGNTIFKSAAFSPDDKFIATTRVDSLSIIYEFSTGDVFQTLKGHSKQINTISFSRDNKYVLSCSEDNTAKIFDVFSGRELITIKNKTNWINSVMYSPNCKSIALVDEKRVTMYDGLSGKEIYTIMDRTSKIESLFLNSNNGIGAVGFYSGLSNGHREATSFFQLSNCKTIYFSIGRIYSINSNGEFFLNSNSDDIVEICSINNSIRIPLQGNYGKINSAQFSSNNKFVLTASDDKKVRLYDFLSGELIKVFSTHKKKIYSALFSRDNRYIVTAGKDKTARIYDVYSGDEIQVLNRHKNWVVYANFNNSGDMVLTVTRDNKINVFKVSNGLQLYSYEGYSGIFSPDGSNLITIDKDSSIHVYNMLDGSLVNKLARHTDRINNIMSSQDGKFLTSVSRDGTICIQKLRNMESHKKLIGHKNEVKLLKFSNDGNLIYSYDKDNRSILWSTKTFTAIYERIQLENNNWLVKLPNSPYYMCSKDASKMLHYVTPSLKVIGFDQLDPVYNRPDIVLDSIGKYFGGADQELVARYREAWEKRIDRLGLDKEKLGKGEISVPNAEFIGAEDIEYENTSGQLALKVDAKDPKYTLRRFNILVNEVPLYGAEGISIASRGLMEWDTTISVPLGIGENKIQVSVMNELGLENFKYPTYVNYTPNNEIISKTYFIGIGVDEFEEDGHDLNYCVKDIEDLSNAFKSSSNTESIVLTNEQVTKEIILALKNTLNNTSVHDKVIISCSSHGLLDDENRFYLATHDVDFSHPEYKGLPYAELEGLLDSIPARQKLLMLDACNSGENEIEQSNRPIATTANTNIENESKTRGEILVEDEQEFQSSFETMMELFVNVSNETGSVIISAAGGKQSALEGEAVKINGKKIENGAFTYSVLEYLKQTDETLTVNGLKSYVEKRVEEITKGKQRPTSRQETMEVDWEINE